eukprot:gene28217-34073_t
MGCGSSSVNEGLSSLSNGKNESVAGLHEQPLKTTESFYKQKDKPILDVNSIVDSLVIVEEPSLSSKGVPSNNLKKDSFLVIKSDDEGSSKKEKPAPAHHINVAEIQVENLPSIPETPTYASQGVDDNVLESPTSTIGDIATFENLRTLRDAHNAHRGESMDDRKLQALFTVFDDDEDREVEISRSLYLHARNSSNHHNESMNLPRVASNRSNHNASMNSDSMNTDLDNKSPPKTSPYAKPPSPAAVNRRKITSPLKPASSKPSLTPSASLRAAGTLDDFADDMEDTQPAPTLATPPKSDAAGGRSPMASSQFITPTLRHVEVNGGKSSAHKVTPPGSKVKSIASATPSPMPKRGFLTQVGGENGASTSAAATSPKGAGGKPLTPSKAYHVLEGGMLYQIDSTTLTPPFSIDNRTLSLRRASLKVGEGGLVELEAEGGSRVSFQVKSEEEREQWVEALKQHIEFSDQTSSE